MEYVLNSDLQLIPNIITFISHTSCFQITVDEVDCVSLDQMSQLEDTW